MGLDVSGLYFWYPVATNYEDLMDRVDVSSPDAVVLAGLLDQNGAKLIQDQVATLGDNETVRLLAFDGFAQQATIDDAGEAAAGMFASVPGRTPGSLEGPGAELVSGLESDLGGEPVELFAPYAGQAAEVLLTAIESGAERASAIEALFETDVTDGIIGSFRITPRGDPSTSTITALVAEDRFKPVEQVDPERDLIAAARGE